MLYPLYCFDLGTKYTKIMQTKKNLIDKAQFQYFLFFFIFFFLLAHDGGTLKQ